MDELHTIHVAFDEQLTRERIEWWAARNPDAFSDRMRARILACRKWLDEHPEQPEWFTDPRDGTIIEDKRSGYRSHFLDGAWRDRWGTESVRWWLASRCDYCLRRARFQYGPNGGWKQSAQACGSERHRVFAQRDTGLLVTEVDPKHEEPTEGEKR